MHLTTSRFKDLLSKLAFEIQKHGKGTVVERLWAEQQLQTIAASYQEEKVLHLAASASLIDLDEQENWVRFRHGRLQEFFSSLELRHFIEREGIGQYCRIPLLAEQDAYIHREGEPLPPPATTGWAETIVMMVSVEQDGSGLLRQIADVNPLLAGYCLTEGQASTDTETRASITERLLRLATDAAISLRVRVSAGHLLGQVGDPRLAKKSIHGNCIILPSMVKVPSGKYCIGAILSETTYPDEVPRHPVELVGLEIAKYPVTNAEFECFVTSGSYDQEQYWSDVGWSWRQGKMERELKDSLLSGYLAVREQCRQERERLEKTRFHDSTEMDIWWTILMTHSDSRAEQLLRKVCEAEWDKPHDLPTYWNDPAFNGRNQPVIVTWFEANAYCRWLSSVTKRAFRLPTEFEWEAASRGNLEQEYTWKGDWDPANLNTLEGSILSPSPIGIFPHGISTFDALDMLGNVWEWTSGFERSYKCSEPDLLDVSVFRDSRRVVRGGSWAVTRPNARCSCRGNFPADNLVRNYIGFRLCSSTVQ
jgi:formylglycine-generating enzyme required for sulfatase activity